jgi:hypothetical protein
MHEIVKLLWQHLWNPTPMREIPRALWESWKLVSPYLFLAIAGMQGIAALLEQYSPKFKEWVNKEWENTMTTEKRWQIECEIMESRFPSFTPFERSIKDRTVSIGFGGYVVFNKKRFAVIATSPKDMYPLTAPKVVIAPQLNRSHCLPDGALSICELWIPTRHAFATWIVLAIRYIHRLELSH